EGWHAAQASDQRFGMSPVRHFSHAFCLSSVGLHAASSLHFGQILMHEFKDPRAFPNAGSHPLYRAVPHVTYNKNSRNVSLQQTGIAVEGPTIRSLPILEQIGTR